jgi:hypothetical protein
MLTLSWDEKAGSSDTSISSNPNSKDLKQSLAGQISIPLLILFSRHARWNICEHGRIVNGCFIMLKNNSSLHRVHGPNSGTSTPSAMTSGEIFLRIFNAKIL